MSFYRSLCHGVILPLGDRFSGQTVLRYLDYFRETQYLDPEQLALLQGEMIRSTVQTAYREVPFYRDLYDSHGVDVGAVRTRDDLALLPAVSKEMLREAGDAAVRQSDGRTFTYSTSGSTGRPFSLKVDADTVSRARSLMILRTLYSGYRPGDRILQTGTAPKRGLVKGIKDLLLRVRYISAFDLSPELLDRLLHYLDDKKVDYISGYAQSLDLLAERAREVGFNRPLAGAISWGALLLPSYREAIREAFGCQTFDSYGVGEGMQIAAQCGIGETNYHIFSLAVALEVCRGDQPLGPGQLGELLLTRLNPGPTPLIRYRIGDMGELSGDESCPCGRHLPLMKSIVGRTSDIVRTPSGKQLVIHFFSRIFSTLGCIEQFQVVQKDLGRLVIKIVAGDNYDASVGDEIVREIRDVGDPDLSVEIELVEDIPVGDNAKRRYVVSELER